ncbi:MAG: redoxin domain-containing protein [Opitutaceae bacterium]|nr:redoxin domain-containing protein [Opitutaceae bacterium]
MKPSLLLLACLGLLSTAFGKVETWTNTDGQTMEAEAISANAKYVSFRKADGSKFIYQMEKLSMADQERLKPLISTTTDQASPESAPAPAAKPAPAIAGKLTAEIAGKLVSLKGKSLTPVSRETVIGSKYYAIYFSAHWCPPCRGFTPELVAAYKDLKAKNPDFEVVFVSSDQSNDDMKTYMTEYKMPWPAVRFDASKSIPAVQKHRGNGIPHLVFVTSDGEVLSSSYVGDKYVGPQKVLKDIQKKLAGES